MKSPVTRRLRLAGLIFTLAMSLISLPLRIPDSVPAPLKRFLSGIAPTAEAAEHFENGKIAFQSQRTGNFEIFLMNPNGTNLVNISNNPAIDANPAWSRDGTRIAFDSTRDGDTEIYVMNANGTGQTRLTARALIDGDPSFSPDETKIVFHSRRTGNFEIFVMNADGSNQTQLTNAAGSDLHATFSPDGTKIAFTSNRDGNAEIYIMNADGSNETRLTNNPTADQAPAFSPNGKKIAFQRHINSTPQIMLMNPDGSNQTQLTSTSLSKFSPAFSADGNSISFTAGTNNDEEIFIMRADGTGQNQITSSVGDDISAAWQNVFPFDTIGVWRPSTNQFLLRNSNTTGAADITTTFGAAGDQPLVGDWNGDAIDDIGVFRPSTGQFLLRFTTTTKPCAVCPPVTFTVNLTINFGQSGDKAVVGDWNGDGIDTPGVKRGSQWLLTNGPNTNNSSPAVDIPVFTFGVAEDLPVAGDWNGDGLDTVGVFLNGNFLLRNFNTSGPPDFNINFGVTGDNPVTGDWDGDGVDTIGVFFNANFLLRNTNNTGSPDLNLTFAGSGDLPVAGDWDGNPPSNQPPNNGVNDPSQGSSRVNQTQTFTTTCSDPDGWRDISTIDFKIAKSDGNGNGVPVALWVQFDQNRNVIRFYNPDSQTWSEGTPGSNVVLSSRFADLYLEDTQVQGSGPTGPSVQVTWTVVFKHDAVKNNYKQFLKITDDTGLSTGFDNVGSWSVRR